MFKRIQQFFLILLVLLLAYFSTLTASVAWLQTAPKQLVWFAEKLSAMEIGFKDLKLKQTWQGIDVEIRQLQVLSSNRQFYVESIKFDFNFWSPFFYSIDPGQSMIVEGMRLEVHSSDWVDQTDSNDQLFQEMFSAFHLRQLWQKIQFKNSRISLVAGNRFELHIDDFLAYKGLHWRTLGQFSLAIDEKPSILFQLKSDFETTFLSHLSVGTMDLSMSAPVDMSLWLEYLPEQWRKLLPMGNAFVQVQAKLNANQQLKFMTEINAQQLVWPDHDVLMPKSVGVEFQFAPSTHPNQSWLDNWQFQLERLRLDNEFIEAHSPVKVALGEGSRLSFQTQSISLKPFLPIVRRMLVPMGFDLPNSERIALEAANVAGIIDLHDLSLSRFTLDLKHYHWPAYQNSPLISGQDLHLDFADHLLQISGTSDVQIQSHFLRDTPVKLHLPNPLQVRWLPEKALWRIEEQSFWLDTLQFTLTAQIDEQLNCDMNLDIKAKSMDEAKAFIPYPLMGVELKNWLKTALVSGKDVRGQVVLQGNLKNFPFKSKKMHSPSKEKFFAKLSIDAVHLKFQPNWPAITDFKAELLFTPFELQVKAEQAKMLDAVLSDVVVEAKNLDSQNIAVDIQGKARASFIDALSVLEASPLLKKAGIEDFIKDQVQLDGDVQVNLDKVWVPVYGYKNRHEEVKGGVWFDKSEVLIFDRIKITDMQGEVTFTEKSANSKTLKGMLAGGVLNGALSTAEKGHQLNLKLTGMLQAEQLLAEILSSSKSLEGEVPWNLDITLPLIKSESVAVSSLLSLVSVRSKIPQPFDTQFFKLHGQNLKANLQIHDKTLFVDARLTDWGKGSALFNLNGLELKGLTAQFGSKQNSEVLAVRSDHYQIQGNFEAINVEAWQQWQGGGVTSESLPSWVLSHDWRESSLYIQQLQLDKKNHYSDVALRWQYLIDTQEWLAQLDSPDANIYMRRDHSNNYFLQANGISYDPVTKEKEAGKVENCQAWSNLVIKSFNFRGQNLNLAGKLVDELSFNYFDESNKVLIKDLQIKSSALAGGLEGKYQFNKEKNISQLDFKVSSKDLAKLTRYLEIKQGFSGQQGRVEGNLNWTGNLQCFEVSKLNGLLDFSLEEGVIQNAEPGVARLLGLLSIESLARRLKLDIKDVTKAGLAFDKISGKALFDEGIVTLKNFKLLAPSADAEIFGQINLATRGVKLDARITPAIGSTLPIVAAISGVATPIAGLLTYALMKVIPAINEDLITYRYEVSGDIENPVIKDKGLALELLNNQSDSPK